MRDETLGTTPAFERSVPSVTGQSARVYAEIRQRIVEGRYRPGAYLSESVLARVHHASRTPVREALSQLVNEGYIGHSTGRGWSVTEITLTQVRNSFEVRRLLEGAAAGRAAEVALPEEVARIREFASCGFRVQDHDTYMRALQHNLQFHVSIAAGTHNHMMRWSTSFSGASRR